MESRGLTPEGHSLRLAKGVLTKLVGRMLMTGQWVCCVPEEYTVLSMTLSFTNSDIRKAKNTEMFVGQLNIG